MYASPLTVCDDLGGCSTVADETCRSGACHALPTQMLNLCESPPPDNLKDRINQDSVRARHSISPEKLEGPSTKLIFLGISVEQ